MAGLLAFRRLKAACIKGFGARSAEGWYGLYVLRPICSTKANMGRLYFETFCPKAGAALFYF